MYNVPLTEAVNLELVNMNGNGMKNGKSSSPKKETEVHIGDPYDEYFVPVNEHRKYMRYGYTFYYRSQCLTETPFPLTMILFDFILLH